MVRELKTLARLAAEQGARGFVEVVIVVSKRRYRYETIRAVLRQLDK